MGWILRYFDFVYLPWLLVFRLLYYLVINQEDSPLEITTSIEETPNAGTAVLVINQEDSPLEITTGVEETPNASTSSAVLVINQDDFPLEITTSIEETPGRMLVLLY